MAVRGHFCTCLLRLYHHLFRNGGGVSRKAPGNKGGYQKTAMVLGGTVAEQFAVILKEAERPDGSTVSSSPKNASISA